MKKRLQVLGKKKRKRRGENLSFTRKEEHSSYHKLCLRSISANTYKERASIGCQDFLMTTQTWELNKLTKSNKKKVGDKNGFDGHHIWLECHKCDWEKRYAWNLDEQAKKRLYSIFLDVFLTIQVLKSAPFNEENSL